MNNNELLLAMSDLMDQKLKPIKDTLDEHSSILKEHSESIQDIKYTLKEHSESIQDIKYTLKEHGDILKEHSESIQDIKYTLKEHSDILNVHGDGIQDIKLLLENDFQPRLQNVEGCYLSTFTRYRSGVDRLEQLEVDVDSLKMVVKEHSMQLQKIL